MVQTLCPYPKIHAGPAALCPNPKTPVQGPQPYAVIPEPLCRARNAAKARAGDRRSQVQEVRDAAGVAGPDAAKLQVCPRSAILPRTTFAVTWVVMVRPLQSARRQCRHGSRGQRPGKPSSRVVSSIYRYTPLQIGSGQDRDEEWLMQALMDSEDWDPGAYDAAMQSAFGEDYYQVSLHRLGAACLQGIKRMAMCLWHGVVLYACWPGFAAGRR
jgi:KRI1-like family